MKLFFSLGCLVATTCAFGDGNYFTYYEAGGFGPSRWEFLHIDGNQCGGMEGTTGYGQSPVTVENSIRITSGDACDTDKSSYSFEKGDCLWEDLLFVLTNNGVRVEPKNASACSFGRMKIPHSTNKFTALQFHIHTHSEHQIEGHPDSIDGSGFFPAELHVVHEEETMESFAVFSTMISVGPDDHEDFEWYLRGWEEVATQVAESCPVAEEHTDHETSVQVNTQCNATDFYPFPSSNVTWPENAPDLYVGLPTLEYESLGFFTYKGGLTTPGCTEIVNWNILDQPMEISENQLQRLKYLILCYVKPTKDTLGTVTSCEHGSVASESGSTSRPPQALSGRKVLHRCQDGPAKDVNDVGVLPAPGSNYSKPPRAEEPENTDDSPKCDKALHEGCSNDKRYNPKMSPNLKANSPAWYDLEGYWVGSRTTFDNKGAILLEEFASDLFKTTLPYPQDEVFMFLNLTIQETRCYDHLIEVYKPADIDLFCTYVVPENSSNVMGNGTCGKNGYAMYGEQFGTASHEKDGVVHFFAANGFYAGANTGTFFAIDGDSFYSTISGSTFEYSETFAFSNPNKTRVAGTGEYLIKSDVPPYSKNPLARSYTFEWNQVDQETYTKLLEDYYSMYMVLASDQVPIEIDSGYCLEKSACPSEASFQSQDPLTTETPYTEDSGVMGGWIAFFVIIGFFVFSAFGWYCYSKHVQTQTDRYKQQFAHCIAESIKAETISKKFKAEDLEKAFKKIDVDGDGVITKDELKAFVGIGMSNRDLEVMFVAIDLNHSGSIEYSEFVAFMALIGTMDDSVVIANNVAMDDKMQSAPLDKKIKVPVAKTLDEQPVVSRTEEDPTEPMLDA